MPDERAGRFETMQAQAPVTASGEAELLRRARERGILDDRQVEALAALRREIEAEPGGPPDLADDDEHVRFVTGFADIFVTIGIVLVLATTAKLAGPSLGGLAAWGLVAAVAWGLAELFSRRRRMALPSIVLLVAFVGAGFMGAAALLSGDTAWAGAMLGLYGVQSGSDPLAHAGAALAAAGLAVLHYWRFRVPITVAAGAAALVGLAVWLVAAAAPDFAAAQSSLLLALLGLCVFALGMRYDLSDPQRLTRRADIAFWLHMLAAPLIVHPALGFVTDRAGDIGTLHSVAVLGIVLVLTLVALATDRRAILVSGLAYAGIALGTLVQEAGFGSAAGPAAMLALGLFVLGLSVFWKPLRAGILRLLPSTLAARLPRPIGA